MRAIGAQNWLRATPHCLAYSVIIVFRQISSGSGQWLQDLRAIFGTFLDYLAEVTIAP